MVSQSAQRRTTRRTHSLGGCLTCRRRHVKCDQVQPICLTCTAIGATCEFPIDAELRWVPSPSTARQREANAAKPRVNNVRRHLYSEKSRVSMSAALTAGLGSTSIDESLTEIDAKAKDAKGSSPRDIAVGPFSVLNFNSTTPKPDQEIHVDNIDVLDELPTLSPSTIDSFMGFDDSLQWQDLFELGFDNMFIAPQCFSQLSQGHEDLDMTRFSTFGDTTVPSLATDEALSSQSRFGPLNSEVLADAHVLLKHFKDHVITQFSSMPFGSKSPWKIMNLSAAVQTLAGIEFLDEQDLKHASVANLYGVLACAAHHLASSPPPCRYLPQSVEHWEQRVTQCKILAKTHLQHSLKAETQGQGKAKYKDQLMAILSILAFSVRVSYPNCVPVRYERLTVEQIMSGHQIDARCYMLDAERLLRIRGLAKPEISRKARLLHHIYTWIRITGESTYVLHDYRSFVPSSEATEGQPEGAHDDIRLRNISGGHTGRNAKLDDFLAIESHPQDSDLDIYELKEQGVSLRDIHLSISQENPDTMYKQIYGIPETWLSLLSQTTRLANAIDALNFLNEPSNATLLSMLQKRAGHLEHILCSYASRNSHGSQPPTSSGAPTAVENSATQLPSSSDHMLRALSSALVIFFYRRIRNVNPLILQGHVDDVISALSDYDAALEQYQSECLGTPWPAFMAGCEAVSLSKRDALMRWIEKGSVRCGLNGFKGAQDMMKEVWRRRDEGKGQSARHPSLGASGSDPRFNKDRASRSSKAPCTWVDLSREQNVWMMLS